MSFTKRLRHAMRDGGLLGLSLTTASYLLRRIDSRLESSVKRLDRSITENSLMRKYGGLLEKNESYRNCHTGSRCFIIGNGPSVENQDLTPLKKELTFVTNSFWKHPMVGEWQPTYYFLTDPLYFQPDLELVMKDYFAEMCANVPSSTFFLPATVKEAVDRIEPLRARQCNYVGLTGDLAHQLPWEPDLTHCVPGVQNVVQLALMTALYMGCSPIYLLGLDHDWLSHRGTDRHFYKGPDVVDQRVPQSVDWASYGMLMGFVLTMWRGYESIAQVAGARGVRIINLTSGGFLDVFESGEYEAVVSQVG